MALIKCYECGKEISSLAPHCIHCGAPRKAQKKKKASKRKISDDGLTERQREQLERIRATSTKRPTKKKITKKAVKKKSPAKKRIASAYESHIDLVGGRSPRAARNYIDSDASNREISRSKNVSKKKSAAKRPTKKKIVKKASPKKSAQTPTEAGQAFIESFKSYCRNQPLQLTWFLWFFVVGIIVFVFLAATGLSLVLPGWAIGLVMGIAMVIYTIIRGEDPRGVKLDGQLGELSKKLRSGDFGLWFALVIIIGFAMLIIFAFAASLSSARS